MAGPVAINDSEFDREVLQADTPVLVDFWAEWCGPCKMLAPVLDQVAEEYQDRLKVVKLNVDENPATPRQYAIRGIPTLMLFKNGELHGTKSGAMPKQALAGFIEQTL